MSSKTILLGLSIFRCGSERSVHGRPSWELAPYDRESERTKDFTAWCRDASTECCFNERAGECGVVRFTSQFFVLDKSKSIPIRIGGQTAWEAVRNDFIENKEKIASKDYELHVKLIETTLLGRKRKVPSSCTATTTTPCKTGQATSSASVVEDADFAPSTKKSKECLIIVKLKD
ncbi:uncharacterized protein LOC141879376 [Acropora palmata]|uniref:uncharacterized protein LOC141879376 n=1 Tax=Acropora palmata TaxID=6131 RepID=UPI003DA166C4